MTWKVNERKVTFDALTISGIFGPNAESKTRDHGLDSAIEKLLRPEGVIIALSVSTPSPVKRSPEKIHIVRHVN